MKMKLLIDEVSKKKTVVGVFIFLNNTGSFIANRNSFWRISANKNLVA